MSKITIASPVLLFNEFPFSEIGCLSYTDMHIFFCKSNLRQNNLRISPLAATLQPGSLHLYVVLTVSWPELNHVPHPWLPHHYHCYWFQQCLG